MGLPCDGQDSVTAVRRSAAEPNSPPAASALLRCVAEQLCRSPAPLAAPLVRGLHQPRRVQRPAEARLVQPSAEQKLVDLLQLRQREGGRQQMERNRRTDRAACPASSVRSRSSLAAGAAEAAGRPRHATWPRPSTSSPVCRSTSARNATDSAPPDGCRRPPPNAPACSINEGAVPSVLPRELGGLVIDRLVRTQRSPRQLPSLPGPGWRALEEHHEPAAARREDDDVDGWRGATRFGACGRSASGHDRN